MKITATIASTLLIASMALTGCSDDSDTDATADSSATDTASEAPTETAAACTQVSDLVARMTQFGAAVSDPKAAGEAAQVVIDQAAVVEGAPADVQEAVDGVSEGFASAIERDGTLPVENIAPIAGDLEAYGKTLNDYVAGPDCA